MSCRPMKTSPDTIGRWRPNWSNESATADGSSTPATPSAVATHATIVAMITATRPAGRLNGSGTAAVQATRISASVMNATHGTSHIWNAGRMEMKVSDMPARVPSMAAVGVTLRIAGPTKAPINTTMPMMNAHARPACHAAVVLPVEIAVGSIITKTTMNMCGTLGPYGIAVTSLRPSRIDRRRARKA
jgi:hypothetical protein